MANTVTRHIGHGGSVLGEENVELSQNDIGREDTVISLSCPRKFDAIRWVGGRHPTKFIPRTSETFTADGDTYSLETNLTAISGETDIDDQPYPVAVAQEGGVEIEIVDVNYAHNEVTLAEVPTSEVTIYPVMSDGNIKYQGVDVFDNPRGSVQTFGHPIQIFSDLNMLHNENRPHLSGAAEWSEGEKVELLLDAPQQIVWEDEEYPRGEYVSSFTQAVQVR